jgi:cadmium resistance protein CadD (predicted permease)
MVSVLSLAAITFAITNVDDLLILSLYFANPGYRTKSVVLGQYLGIIVIIGISLIGIVLGTLLPQHWISLLGVLPILIGIRALLKLRKHTHDASEEPSVPSRYQFFGVALVTVANGGDNIGVYTPLFAILKVPEIYLYVATFLTLTAVWCGVAYYAVSHPKVSGVFGKYGKRVLPIFLVLLGLYLMKDFATWVLNGRM